MLPVDNPGTKYQYNNWEPIRSRPFHYTAKKNKNYGLLKKRTPGPLISQPAGLLIFADFNNR